MEEVKDPEVPVLSIIDLGIVREVLFADQKAKITITPTYSGCPAMNHIEKDILHVLNNQVAHPYLFLEADQGKQENIATNKKFSLIFCCPVFFV